MSEPSLETISDYDTLDKNKKRMLIVISVTIITLGVIYSIISNVYGTVDDAITVEETIKSIPVR